MRWVSPQLIHQRQRNQRANGAVRDEQSPPRHEAQREEHALGEQLPDEARRARGADRQSGSVRAAERASSRFAMFARRLSKAPTAQEHQQRQPDWWRIRRATPRLDRPDVVMRAG